jgi:hypothetical protein
MIQIFDGDPRTGTATKGIWEITYSSSTCVEAACLSAFRIILRSSSMCLPKIPPWQKCKRSKLTASSGSEFFTPQRMFYEYDAKLPIKREFD